MGLEVFIPISLFVCITLSIKFLMDGFTKRRLAQAHASEELVRTMLAADEKNNQLSAFKWGLVLTAVGIALGVIELTRMDPEDPGAAGLLIGAAGIGMLVFHFLANKSRA